MVGFVGSRNTRYRHVLFAVSLLLLVTLSVPVALAGCGEKGPAVQTEQEEKETEPGVEEDQEETSGEEYEEEEYEEEEGETVELGAEYINDHSLYGFSVSYPEDWECEVVEGGTGCKITNPGETSFFQILIWGEPRAGATPEEKIEEYAAKVSENWPIERDPSTLVSGTFDGAEYAYDYWSAETSVGFDYHDVMYATDDYRLFGFLSISPADKVEEYGPLVEAMIDSFALTPTTTE